MMDPRMEREMAMLQRRGVNLSDMRNHLPVTQQDRERLGRRRSSGLARLRTLSLVMGVASVIGIACGIASNRVAGPNYEFPQALPGGAIAGVGTLIMALMGLCIVRSGRSYPTGDETGFGFRCLLVLLFIVGMFVSQACFIAFGIAGVWPLAECTRSDVPENTLLYKCSLNPNKDKIVLMAVLTVIISLFLGVCSIVATCFFCCYNRAFGFKSRYEVLIDYQTARMMELNPQMNPQMAPNMMSPQVVPLTTPGQAPQPGAPLMYGGQLYVPAQGPTSQPSAPPASVDVSNGNRYQGDYDPSQPPPSYDELKRADYL